MTQRKAGIHAARINMQPEIQRPGATDYGQPIQPGGQTLKLFLNAVGAIFFLLGVALAFGNKTGRFVTFPFSGFTAMAICGILAKASNASKKINSLPAMMGRFSSNPSDVPPALDSPIKYKFFAQVPWFRREPSGMVVLLLLVFSPALLALCIVALTGDVCRNAYDKNGNLVSWGIASKSAAILLLFAQLCLAAIYYETNKPDGHQPGKIQSAQPTLVAPVLQPEAPPTPPQAHAGPAPASAQPDSQFDFRSFTLCFLVIGLLIFLFAALPDRHETQGWDSGQDV
jgi:hypothetical protein